MITTMMKAYLAQWRWFMKAALLAVILSLGFPMASLGQESLTFSRAVGPTSDLSLEVLTEAYQRIGITIKATGLPGERALVEANKGAYDGEVTRVGGIEEHYPNLVPVPVPVTTTEGMTFTKKLAIAIDGWASLEPYSIVIRRGLKFAEKGTRGMKVTLVATYDEAFNLIARDRHDVIVCDRLTGYYFIKKYHYVDLKALEPPLSTFHLYHYLHKKHARLIPEITAALTQMQAEGRIKGIRAAYVDGLLQTKTGD